MPRADQVHFTNERCPECKRMCRGITPHTWHCDRCKKDFTKPIYYSSSNPDLSFSKYD